jgi:hypothetical protein
MKKYLFTLCLALLPLAGFAGDETVKTSTTGSVTIQSAGNDLRLVLHNLFTQAKKNYVLDPHPFAALHLSLSDVEFEEALQLVCKLGKLTYEVQNGIYFIGKAKASAPGKIDSASSPAKQPQPIAAPKGPLPATVFNKKVTTRLQKTDMRAVFAEFSKQTGVAIEIEKAVPAYKIDAFLINASLRYSLDAITQAAGLRYRLTDRQSIEIYKTETEQNRVTIVGSGGGE